MASRFLLKQKGEGWLDNVEEKDFRIGCQEGGFGDQKLVVEH